MKNPKNLTRGVDLSYLWFYQASDKRPFAERRQRNEAQTERTSVEQSRDSKRKESCKTDRKQRGSSVNRDPERLQRLRAMKATGSGQKERPYGAKPMKPARITVTWHKSEATASGE